VLDVGAAVLALVLPDPGVVQATPMKVMIAPAAAAAATR
jgi:hypothetical protein